MQASLGRKILSWIIDLLVLSVPLYYLKLLLPFQDGGPVAVFGAYVLAFLVLRMILAEVVGTPGYHCLAIDSDDIVVRDVKERETMLTITVGVLLIFAGRAWLLRWHMDPTVYPVFGMLLTAEGYAVVSILWGLCDLALGLLILNMTRLGFYLAIAAAVVGLLSVIASWAQLDALVMRMLLSDATVQDLPSSMMPLVNDLISGVLRFMHWASILPPILLATIVGLHARRFRVLPEVPSETVPRRRVV